MPTNSNINPETKKSLILAGGGMRLAYQGGVLMALRESQLTFDHIDGTSGGIFNAGMLGSGLEAKEIAGRWRKLNIKNFMSMRPLKKYFKPLNMMGYADADGIRDKIFPNLGIDINKINAHTSPDITFNVCNFSDKTVESVHHTIAEEDHLIAGVSLPIVMPALKIGNSWYSDAVWIKDANLMEAVKRGAEELWLVWAIGNTETYLPGALNQYVHMIEMSANGGLLEEYERIRMINDQINDKKNIYGQKKAVKLFVIKPEYPLPLDPDFFFNKIDARSLINMGYAEAKNCLNSIPEKGVNFDKDATKMKDPGIRLNIRNQFSGVLSSKNEKFKAAFYLYMVFSSHADQETVRHYSSIYLDQFGEEIPCYNHQVVISDDKKNSVWTCSCNFLHNQVLYTLNAVWSLGSPIDLLLGLEFKHVKISVFKNSEPIVEGILYQNIQDRLKSWFSTNIRKQDGTSGGIGLKYRMASKLIDYAI